MTMSKLCVTLSECLLLIWSRYVGRRGGVDTRDVWGVGEWRSGTRGGGGFGRCEMLEEWQGGWDRGFGKGNVS